MVALSDLSDSSDKPSPSRRGYVDSNKSTVELIQPLMFERLDLTLKNGSTFKLTHPFKTKALQAIIDPKTKIVGDFKSIQSIKSLIK